MVWVVSGVPNGMYASEKMSVPGMARHEVASMVAALHSATCRII